MTLIAIWVENNIPFLMGDVLISAYTNSEEPHHPLPTRNDLERILPSYIPWRIVDTCQKAYIVSKTLCVAWSGHKVTAKQIFECLVRAFDHVSPSTDEVRKFFIAQDEYSILPCVFIGWIIEGNRAFGFKWNSERPTELEMAHPIVEGSGGHFSNEMFHPAFMLGKNPIESAVSRIGYAIKDEVLYGTNLWALFGGGFTIIYWNGVEFEILPSVTYVFLQIEESDDMNVLGLRLPERLLKFQQGTEVLEIIAVLPDAESFAHNSVPSKLINYEMHYVFPISATSGDPYTVDDNLSLKSNFYCLCVDVKLRDKLPEFDEEKFLLFSLVLSVEEAKNRWVKIDKTSEGVEGIEITDDFFKVVIKALGTLDRAALKEQMLREHGKL